MLKLLFCVFPILSTLFLFEKTADNSTQQLNEIIASDEFVDARDGEIYKTMMIGDQRWFVENLRYDVPGIVTGFYNIDTILSSDELKHYGRLYDWNTLMNRESIFDAEKKLSSENKTMQGICPDKWHVPSDEEWKAVERFLGMKEDAIQEVSIEREMINIQKVVSSVDWVSDKTTASESLLNVFPTGRYTPIQQRKKVGFFNLGEKATFWTSTESSDETVWGRTIKYNKAAISRYDKYKKGYGYSCRCVED
jgi:uncharacterized protein (TIGR02145 family)